MFEIRCDANYFMFKYIKASITSTDNRVVRENV